jgi:ferredoxin
MVRWFNEIDWAVRNGDWFAFNRLTKPKLVKKNEASNEETTVTTVDATAVLVNHSDDEVKEKYGKLIDAFKEACVDFPRKECELCHEYCKTVKPMVDCSKMKQTEYVVEIKEHMMQIYGGNKLMVCEKCYAYLKDGNIPLFSKMNNIGFDKIPDEIRCLNNCELTLIKLARTFQTVVRLQPVSKRGGPSSDHVQALKGLALHLPLPMNKTHAYVKSTLPNAENVTILVNSVPTKKKDVWQSVVDWDKVVRAVEYLKVCKFLAYSSL